MKLLKKALTNQPFGINILTSDKGERNLHTERTLEEAIKAGVKVFDSR